MKTRHTTVLAAYNPLREKILFWKVWENWSHLQPAQPELHQLARLQISWLLLATNWLLLAPDCCFMCMWHISCTSRCHLPHSPVPSHLEKQRKRCESHVLWLSPVLPALPPSPTFLWASSWRCNSCPTPQSGSWTTSLASHSAPEWMITLPRWSEAKREHLRGLCWCHSTSQSTPGTASDLLPSAGVLDHCRIHQQWWLEGGQKTARECTWTTIWCLTSAENKDIEREFWKHKRPPANAIIQGQEEGGLT